MVRNFTPSRSDYDSNFNVLLVLAVKRTEIEQGSIPEVFTPTTGKWRMKCKLDVLPLPPVFPSLCGGLIHGI